MRYVPSSTPEEKRLLFLVLLLFSFFYFHLQVIVVLALLRWNIISNVKKKKKIILSWNLKLATILSILEDFLLLLVYFTTTLNANIVQPSQFRAKLLNFQNNINQKINYPHFFKEVKTFFLLVSLACLSIPEYIFYWNIEYAQA